MKFLWGAATSSHQIEGGNRHNDWWEWESQGNIEGGVRSGLAADHWNRFREDLRLASELGLNSYRFSIEWSRIEPEEGKWDDEAMSWYQELVTECERLGLLPMLTLHHFTSPQWLADKGGFTHPNSPKYFARFTERVIEKLGTRIPLWCTLNEPMVLAVGSYMGKFMPPAKYHPRNVSLASENLLKAHVLAYDLIHSKIRDRSGPWKDHPIRVGIAHNMLDFKPDRSWHPLELLLSQIFRRFYNRSWLDAIVGRKQHFGVRGLVPYGAQVKEALGRRTADFIGINYYTKAYIQWGPRDAAQERPAELPIGVQFARRKEKVSDLGWALHPQGLDQMIRFVSGYELPIYITENGIADREDKLRAEYLEAHLGVVQQARKNGVDLRGYYYWSLMDNFEWIKGFGPRFGLYHVNYETFERTATLSSQVYKKFIADDLQES